MFEAVASVALCCLFVGVLVPALMHKLRERQRFSAALAAYRLVPEGLLAAAVWLVVFAESLVVFLMLSNPSLGMLLAVALFGGYGVAIAINMARGRSHIDCGCGDEPTPLSWRILLRNVTLVSLAVYGSYAGNPEVSLGVLAVGISLGLVALILYMAFEQLIANSGRHQRLWLGAA